MAKKRNRKTKNIIRSTVNGDKVNYGHLMVGYVNGIMCLASREVLMVLGIRLSDHKVPEWFYHHHHLEVTFLDNITYKIYTERRSSLYTLGLLLSRNKRTVKCFNDLTGAVTRKWVAGNLVETDGTPDFETPKIQQVQYKVRHKKTNTLGRAWLVIKRLFSREEVMINDQ